MEYDSETIQKVWEKADKVSGRDPAKYRKDECGAWIERSKYGYRNVPTSFGWVIDKIDPEGGSPFPNLRPLQWRNALDKKGNKPTCRITAVLERNIDKGSE